MSNMELEVSFLAGTSVESAIEESKRLAKQLNLSYVKFKFNGTSFAVGQNANVEKATAEYLNNAEEKHIVAA